MSRVHKNQVSQLTIFLIIISFILCVTCSSYERAGYFFAASLPVFSSSNQISRDTVAEIQNPHVQLDFDQDVVATIETTATFLIQNPSQLRTAGRMNRLTSLLQVLFLLFLSYLGLRTLLLGFAKVHQEASYALIITHYIEQRDGKK